MQMESKYLLKSSHFWDLSDLKQNKQKKPQETWLGNVHKIEHSHGRCERMILMIKK